MQFPLTPLDGVQLPPALGLDLRMLGGRLGGGGRASSPSCSSNESAYEVLARVLHIDPRRKAEASSSTSKIFSARSSTSKIFSAWATRSGESFQRDNVDSRGPETSATTSHASRV